MTQAQRCQIQDSFWFLDFEASIKNRNEGLGGGFEIFLPPPRSRGCKFFFCESMKARGGGDDTSKNQKQNSEFETGDVQ